MKTAFQKKNEISNSPFKEDLFIFQSSFSITHSILPIFFQSHFQRNRDEIQVYLFLIILLCRHRECVNNLSLSLYIYIRILKSLHKTAFTQGIKSQKEWLFAVWMVIQISVTRVLVTAPSAESGDSMNDFSIWFSDSSCP